MRYYLILVVLILDGKTDHTGVYFIVIVDVGSHDPETGYPESGRAWIGDNILTYE